MNASKNAQQQSAYAKVDNAAAAYKAAAKADIEAVQAHAASIGTAGEKDANDKMIKADADRAKAYNAVVSAQKAAGLFKNNFKS